MICPRCGFANDDSDVYCGGCGAKLVSYCPSCGNVMTAGRKYCSTCGSSDPEVPQYRVAGRQRVVNPNDLVWPGQRIKSPLLAAALNVLWGGLGNLYLEQTSCGLTLMAFDLILAFMTFGVAHIIVIIFLPIFAYKEAMKLRRGCPIHKWGMSIEQV